MLEVPAISALQINSSYHNFVYSKSFLRAKFLIAAMLTNQFGPINCLPHTAASICLQPLLVSVASPRVQHSPPHGVYSLHPNEVTVFFVWHALVLLKLVHIVHFDVQIGF